MTLDQARTIIDNPGSTPQADWQIAGRLIAKHYRDHPEQLKPARLGPMTYDAKPRSNREAITRNLNATKAMVDDLLRLARKRGLTRDQGSARKVMRLDAPASVYRVTTDPDGVVWLIEEGAQTGKRPPAADPDLMEADPPLKMGPTMMGDLARHKYATAARDAGAKFAEAFNQRQRQRYGQQ